MKLPTPFSTNFNVKTLHMSQKEIAEELGVSQQYVQQTETRAMAKFKRKFCALYPDTWRLIKNDIERGWFGKETMPVL